MAETQSFNLWRRSFERSTRGARALRMLQKAFPAESETEQVRATRSLREAVLGSCYGAAVFDSRADPSTLRRADDTKAIRAARFQIKSIRVLVSFLKKHPRAADVALGRAILALKAQGIAICATDSGNHRISTVLEKILNAYEAGLRPPLPLVRAGPEVARFTYGCLLYDTPADVARRRRPPEVETMLLFDLVQTFSLRSRCISSRQTGQPMPDDWESHSRLGMAFVIATFSQGRRTLPESVRRQPMSAGALKRLVPLEESVCRRLRLLLKANPRLGYYGWPTTRRSSAQF